MLAISVLSAILPSLILLWYFYSHDVNPEPGKAIFATFGFGILIVVPVAILELTVFGDIFSFSNPFLAGLCKAFWGASVPEEILKYILVVYYCSRLKTFDERMDGMVYGAVASLGFATMENILYVTRGDLTLAMSRALTAVPCHAFLGAIMGYFVGQARFDSKNRSRLLAMGLALVIFLHGLYDFPLLTLKELRVNSRNASTQEMIAVVSLSSVALGVLMFEGYIAVHLVRRLRATQLQVKERLDAIAREKL